MGDVFHRYALALALVPDQDAAGDLFMDAPTEAVLRRAAARWRSRHGLPDLSADPSLPALTDEQREHALHLAGRGQWRRRLRMGLSMAAAAVSLFALLVAAPAILPAEPPQDPVFAGRPAYLSEPFSQGGRFGVYLAEAAPGAVTIWWEVTGTPAAGDRSPAPELLISGSGGPWLQLVRTEVTHVRKDRALGRSVYRVATGLHLSALVRLGDREVKVPLVRVEQQQGARQIAVRRSLSVAGYVFTVDELVAAPDYTLLRYRVTALDLGVGLRHLVRAVPDQNGGVPLEPLAPAQVVDGTVTVLLEPLPPRSGEVAVWFQPPGGPILSPPQPGELAGLSRDGETVTARLRLHSHNWDRYSVSPVPLADWQWTPEGTILTDGAGKTYPGLAIYEGEDTSRQQYLWRVEAQVPPSVSLEEIQVSIARPGVQRGLRLMIQL